MIYIHYQEIGGIWYVIAVESEEVFDFLVGKLFRASFQ